MATRLEPLHAFGTAVPSTRAAKDGPRLSIYSPCFGQTGLESCGLGRGTSWTYQSARANADDHGFKGASMLATLNAKQIVDEIVKDTIKDTVKDNDPHDALDITPEVVLASRATKDAPALAPEIASRHEPKISLGPEPS